MIETFQKEWDAIKKEEKKIENKKNQLIHKLAQNEFLVSNGKVTKDEVVYAMDYLFTYRNNNHSDVNSEESIYGMIEVSEKAYRALDTAFKKDAIQFDVVKQFIHTFTKVSAKFYEEKFESSNFVRLDEYDEDSESYSNHLLKWSSDFDSGYSQFNVTKRKRSEIVANPHTFEEIDL